MTKSGEAKKWIKDHLDYTGNDCLIWPYGRIANGYCVVGAANRKTEYVHRIMCKHRHGVPPTSKHEAAHSCGNGAGGCVSPDHLFWKTHKENEADKLMHGTVCRGEDHAHAKLTTQDVLAIRSNMSVPEKVLAKRFGVKPAAIGKIKRNERWAWLQEE